MLIYNGWRVLICQVGEQDDTGTRRRLLVRTRRAAPVARGVPPSVPLGASRYAGSTPAPAKRLLLTPGRDSKCGPGWRNSNRPLPSLNRAMVRG